MLKSAGLSGRSSQGLESLGRCARSKKNLESAVAIGFGEENASARSARKSRRRNERTLTFSSVRSFLKREGRHHSYWGQNPADAQWRLVGRGAGVRPGRRATGSLGTIEAPCVAWSSRLAAAIPRRRPSLACAPGDRFCPNRNGGGHFSRRQSSSGECDFELPRAGRRSERPTNYLQRRAG